MSNPPTAEAETNLCFDDLTLRQYLLGSADDVLAGSIENHLSGCNACDANLARVEQESSQNSDAFVKSLGQLNRHSNDNSDGADDDASSDLENVVDQIKQLPVDSTHANPQPGMMLPGRELGGYELLEPIGRGGMGVVFRANHKRLGKEFAVKVLPANAPNAAGTLDRFQQEVSTAGRLQHDAIVQATDAGEENGVSFLVMELVEGVDLGFLLKNVGRLDVGCAAEIIRQTAIGLEYAHQQGVIHRDIKPSNLMLDHSGRLRILDFRTRPIKCLALATRRSHNGRPVGGDVGLYGP